MDVTRSGLEEAPGRAIERLMGDLGFSAKELADALGVVPRTLERWHAGGAYPQRETRRRLAGLLDLDRRLSETFEDREAVHLWMGASNRYLGGLTPAEAVRAGRADRVEAALEALDSGVFL